MLGCRRCHPLRDERFLDAPYHACLSPPRRIVARLDTAGSLEFVVVDADGAPTLYDLPEFGGRLSGSGEVAWVKAGRIVHTSVWPYWNGPESFEAFTAAFLKDVEPGPCEARTT